MSCSRSSGEQSLMDNTVENGGNKRYHLRPVSRETRSKLAELAAYEEEEEDFCNECFRDTARTRRYPHLRSNRDCATVRERNRMHTLNRAFEQLRNVIPKSNHDREAKLSKIATLRLAIHYISVLASILERGSNGQEDECLEPTSKRLRTGRRDEEEEETASNSSSNEMESECSPQGVFFNESKYTFELFFFHQNVHIAQTTRVHLKRWQI